MAEKSAGKNRISVRSARMIAVCFLLAGVLLGIFDAPHLARRALERWGMENLNAPFRFLESRFPYRLGLDVQGGTHLVYRADTATLPASDRGNAVEALRDVIERRINLFGVAEPLVQADRSGAEDRLIVEIAGIRDIGAAIRLIGETPYLEFREERADAGSTAPAEEEKQGGSGVADFIPTELTGRFVKRADVEFDPTSFQPEVSLELTAEGGKIFADLTRRNIGKRLAIYLDGVVVSAPAVPDAIEGGRARITGNFTPDEARILAGRLNAGALPVPISLIARQDVEASLGRESFAKSVQAGALGFLAVAAFMIFFYRLPGAVAVAALLMYGAIMLALFKLIPVTLTIAGIAGFILSIGMAVDANILIFERFGEEMERGASLRDALAQGFGRAWTSIRDSNVSSLITAAILYWLGTSAVRGFALTLGIGILVSMFSAISLSRTLLFAAAAGRAERLRFLFLSGFLR